MLTAADWAIVAVIAVSALLSVLRGFVREAISLGAWVGAFVITGNFYSDLAARLTYFQDELTRNVLAIIGLFVATLLIIGMCGKILRSLMKKAGLSGTDRLLGIVFGVLRGILIVCAILALLQIFFKLHILTFMLSSSWWQQSVFIPEMQRIVNWFFIYLGTPITGA